MKEFYDPQEAFEQAVEKAEDKSNVELLVRGTNMRLFPLLSYWTVNGERYRVVHLVGAGAGKDVIVWFAK